MLTALAAGVDAGAPCVVSSSGRSATYGEVRSEVASLVERLRSVVPGIERRAIAVDVADPSGFLLASLAVLEAGGVLVPVHPRATDAQRAELLSSVSAAALVLGAGFGAQTAIAGLDGEPRQFDERAALVLSTSGSAGVPKRVVLGREGLLANVDAILEYLPMARWPRAAVAVPLSYSYGLVGQCFTSLRCGAAIILLGDMVYPAVQVTTMRELGASGLSTVPASLRLLSQVVSDLEPDERPELGYVASAGGVLTRATVAAVRGAFPGARLFNQYGLTEASPRVTALADDAVAFERGSVGKPLAGVTVEIRDGERLCAPGEHGEVVVRGPSVMLEYLDDPEGTAEVLRDGALRTGDLGYLDEQGYLYVEGRNDDLINVAGERMSLHEIADTVRTVDGVRDVFVAAVDDDLTGHKLVAVVATDGDVAALRKQARALLPPAKRPVEWLIVGELPRTANGKLDRGKMREWARAGRSDG